MSQSVNEESLKKLQEYLCTLQVGRQKVAPLSLVFYIRDTAAETKSQGTGLSHYTFSERQIIAWCAALDQCWF